MMITAIVRPCRLISGTLGYVSLSGYGTRFGSDTDAVASKGLETGCLYAMLPDIETLLGANYYYDDKKNRIIQRRMQTMHGGLYAEDIAYNFTGNILSRRESCQPQSGAATDVLINSYTYDDRGRLLVKRHPSIERQSLRTRVPTMISAVLYRRRRAPAPMPLLLRGNTISGIGSHLSKIPCSKCRWLTIHRSIQPQRLPIQEILRNGVGNTDPVIRKIPMLLLTTSYRA